MKTLRHTLRVRDRLKHSLIHQSKLSVRDYFFRTCGVRGVPDHHHVSRNVVSFVSNFLRVWILGSRMLHRLVNDRIVYYEIMSLLQCWFDLISVKFNSSRPSSVLSQLPCVRWSVMRVGNVLAHGP